MKKITSVFLLLCVLSLSSCQKGSSRHQNVVNITPLKEYAITLLDDPTLVELSVDDIDFTLDLSQEDYQNAFVLLSTGGASIDEIGVFVAHEDDADDLADDIRDYIKDCQETKKEWLNSYNPEEVKKLENGKMVRYGSYLVYAFLDTEKSSSFFKEAERFFEGN